MMVTFEEFEKSHEKSRIPALLRLAHDWYKQAYATNEALEVLKRSNVNLAALNDHLVTIIQQLDAVDKISPEVLREYRQTRIVELEQATQFGKWGMRENGQLYIRGEKSKAAKNKRPKDKPTAKSQTVNAMRLARQSDQTLRDFIDAAGVGSFENLKITQSNKNGLIRYEVDCEISKDPREKKVAFSTLEGWWREAAI